MLQLSILLIDDHVMFRNGLRMVLESEFDNTHLYEADSLAATLELTDVPNLVLLDIQLAGINGLEAISSIKKKWPHVSIIIVSAFNSSENIEFAKQQGVAAFVSKTESSDRIVSVVKQVRKGLLLNDDLSEMQLSEEKRLRLTPRQSDVLELLSFGYTNKVIAKKLNISENTVRWHVQALLELFSVASRSEVVFYARQKGLVK